MKFRKKWLLLLCAVVMAFVFLFAIFSIPFSIKQTFDAMEVFVDGSQEDRKAVVTIDGRYHNNFLQNDTFTGRIFIDGYPVTENELELTCISSSGHFHAGMQYEFLDHTLTSGGDVYEHFVFGRVYASALFKKLIIVVQSENGTDHSLIMAPATSIGDAETLVDEFFSVFHDESFLLRDSLPIYSP